MRMLGSIWVKSPNRVDKTLFLYQVIANKALPFIIKSPNRVTQEAMVAARKGKGLEQVSLKELSDEW